jgi:hypothetical protein
MEESLTDEIKSSQGATQEGGRRRDDKRTLDTRRDVGLIRGYAAYSKH